MEQQIVTDQNILGLASIVFGALIGSVKRIMKMGWKGWTWFGMSLLVNIFSGLTAYLLAIQNNLEGLYPVIIALVFGSLGEKAGDMVLQSILDFLKFKLDIKDENK